jgi:hypothetical protein
MQRLKKGYSYTSTPPWALGVCLCCTFNFTSPLHSARQGMRWSDEWMTGQRTKERKTRKDERNTIGKVKYKMFKKSCQMSNGSNTVFRNIPNDHLSNDDLIHQNIRLS